MAPAANVTKAQQESPRPAWLTTPCPAWCKNPHADSYIDTGREHLPGLRTSPSPRTSQTRPPATRRGPASALSDCFTRARGLLTDAPGGKPGPNHRQQPWGTVRHGATDWKRAL